MPLLRARQEYADLEAFVDIRHKGSRRLVRRGADVCWIGSGQVVVYPRHPTYLHFNGPLDGPLFVDTIIQEKATRPQ